MSARPSCFNCRAPLPIGTPHRHLCMDCVRAAVVSSVLGALAAELVRLAFGWLA